MSKETILKDYHESLLRDAEAEDKNRSRILSYLHSRLEPDYFIAINDWMADEENGIIGDLQIVNETIGEWQDESSGFAKYWSVLKGMYVDQYCGYFGDDYSGSLEIKISDSEYLRASFQL